jgi:hypothetical protein
VACVCMYGMCVCIVWRVCVYCVACVCVCVWCVACVCVCVCRVWCGVGVCVECVCVRCVCVTSVLRHIISLRHTDINKSTTTLCYTSRVSPRSTQYSQINQILPGPSLNFVIKIRVSTAIHCTKARGLRLAADWNRGDSCTVVKRKLWV